MNLQDIRLRLHELDIDIFTTKEFRNIFGLSEETSVVKLARYKKQGYLNSPKRGIYYFSDDWPDKFRIANCLYIPSYVSLESILSKEGVIPEAVYSITSITTKATREFTDSQTAYNYLRIKKEAYTGYFKEGNILVAFPEKALVDYLYFVAQGKKILNDRLNLSKLNSGDILRYVSIFNDVRLNNLINKLKIQ